MNDEEVETEEEMDKEEAAVRGSKGGIRGVFDSRSGNNREGRGEGGEVEVCRGGCKDYEMNERMLRRIRG